MNSENQKILRKTSILILNAILCVTIVLLFIFYVNQNNDKIYNQNIRDIQNVNQATSQISSELYSSIETKQKNVSKYTENRKSNLTDFMNAISEIVVEDNATFQVLDTSSKGYSLNKDSEGNFPEVKYTDESYASLKTFASQASSENLGNYLTLELTNYENAIRCFGRVSYITLYEGDNPVYYSLLLLYKSQSFTQSIGLNGGFDNLSNVLINEDGSYVLRNESFKDDTFFKYLYNYNNLNITQINKIKQQVQANDGGVITLKNSVNQECVFTYSKVANTNWTCVSSVPLDSFHNADPDFHFVVILIILLISLAAIDLIYFANLNRKFKQVAKEANAANTAKSNFLSSMSHDIRTPMNAIIGMTSVVNDELKKDKLDRDAISYGMKMIETSGNNLITLINDILDISKIESGKIVLASEPFSITEAMNHVVDIVQQQIKDKHFDFNVHIHDVENEFVIGDELRMTQIFMNILSNAVKYTEANGKISVDLYQEKEADNPQFSKYIYVVEDNGIGMSEEFVKQIFSRFSRAVDTRINKVQGSGLGMSIVKQLVDLMEGIFKFNRS